MFGVSLYNPDEQYDIWFNSDDPIIGDEISDNGVIFSDEFFNGKNYELVIYIDKQYTPFLFTELRSVSKEYFLYMRSYFKYVQTNGDFLAEPVMVYNNINNGIGIFAGFSTSTKLIILPVINRWKNLTSASLKILSYQHLNISDIFHISFFSTKIIFSNFIL